MIGWLAFFFIFSSTIAQIHESKWKKVEVEGILCRKDSQYRVIFEEPIYKRKACRILKSSQIVNQGFFQDSGEAKKCVEQSRQAFQELGWFCEELRIDILRQSR